MTKQKATRPERIILQFPSTAEELKRLDAVIEKHTVIGMPARMSRAAMARTFFLHGLEVAEKAGK